jgi:cell division septation protein DedD
MADRSEKRDEKGLSARYLVLMFLMGVAACAVFFSLGFLVGYNERASRTAPVTEQVTTPSVVPPTVNPPLETPSPGSQESAAGGAAAAPAQPKPSEETGQAKRAAPAAAPPTSAQPPLSAAAKPGVPTTATPPPRAAGGVEVSSAFTVQVAASRNQRDAEKLVKELKARGYAVFVVTPEFAHANDNLFRVQVGPFATREEADQVRAKIAKEGFKPFIRH